MNRKLFVKISVTVLAVIFVFTAFGFAFAREREKEHEEENKMSVSTAIDSAAIGWGEMKKLAETSIKESVVVGPSVIMRANGDFRVSGVVVNSVNAFSGIINVSFFGFSRDINVSGAKIFGGGKEISLSDIQAGDKLNAFGNYNAATKVITVYEIKDVSLRKNIIDIEARIQQILEMIQKLQAQIKARL